MDASMPAGQKNEVMCIKSEVHLKYVRPIDVEQTTERYLRRKV